MEDDLKFYREYNDRRFDEIRSDIRDLATRLEELNEFKISQIATSRTISVVISAICGLITLIVSSFLTVKFH